MSKNTTQKIHTLDLFCGAGGFSIGVDQSDSSFEIIGGVDMDESAIDTFEANHSNAKGFVQNLVESDPESIESVLNIQSVNMVIGGPPCKGFSSIRPNRSSTEIDYRNYLYQDYMRFVDHFEPEIFIMENVPQIINHTISGEPVLNMITDEITEMGYKYDWKILNAAYYGVPQARTRFILIGVKSPELEIQFPNPTHKFVDPEVKAERVRYTDHTIQPNGNEDNLRPVVTSTEAISDLPYINAGETENVYASLPKVPFQKKMRTRNGILLTESDLTYHSATNHSDRIIAALEPGAFKREDIPKDVRPTSGYSATYSRIYPDEPSTTITTNYTTAGASRSVHPHEDVARALTIREGMRIQSFPDWIKFCGSKTSITEQVGNAVPPLLGKAIGTAASEMFRSID